MPTYTINEEKGQCNRNNRTEDKSFKSCICLLLVFITLCAILFIASVIFEKKENSDSTKNSEVENLNENKAQISLPPFERIVELTTRITTSKEYEHRFETTIEDADKTSSPQYSMNLTTSTTEIVKTISTEQSLTTTTTIMESNLVTDTTEELPNTTINQDEVTEQSALVISIDETETLTATTEVEELDIKSIITSTEITFAELSSTSLTVLENLITTTEVEDLNVIGTTEATFGELTNLPETEQLGTTITVLEKLDVKPIITSTEYYTSTEFLTTILPDSDLRTLALTTEIGEVLQAVTSSTTPRSQTLRTTSEMPVLLRTPEKTLVPPCLTTKCKSVASIMLYRMNPSQDPCEDFYGYACGGPGTSVGDDGFELGREEQIANQIFLEAEKNTQKERLQNVLDMVKYYEVCVKEAYEERHDGKLRKVIDMLKGMNLHQFMVPHDGHEGVQNVTFLFEKMILMQLSPIFDIKIGLGFDSGNIYRIEISPAPIYTPSAIYLDEGSSKSSDIPISSQTLLWLQRCFAQLEDRFAKERTNVSHINKPSVSLHRLERFQCLDASTELFVNSVLNISRTVLERMIYLGQGQLEEKELKKDLLDILHFANENFIKSAQEDSSPKVNSLGNLEMSYPIIIWVDLFSKLTSNTFKQNSEIYWNQKESLGKMFKYLQKFPAYRIYNTFLALFAMDLYVNLVEPQSRITSVRSHCQMETISVFPHVSSNLYINSVKLSDQETMDEYLEDIFIQLKKNLTGSFQEADWMDKSSKSYCVNALDDLNLHLANEELSLGDDEINNLYKNVGISSNYAENYINMVSLKRKLWFELYGQQFKVQHINGFFINSYDVKPKSIISENLIVIPVGMVDTHNPIGMPRFLTMARIGIHVAIEMGKRFDPVGITQGISLTEASELSYNAFKAETKDQFTYRLPTKYDGVVLKLINYDDPHDNTQRSDPSLNSRIADSMAFRLVLNAFGSYQEMETLPWLNEIYSNEQIYIISTIQEFCKKKSLVQYLLEILHGPVLPPTDRVTNMVMNTLPFSNAFNCPHGVEMNSPIKLQFPYIEPVEFEQSMIDYGTLQN